ncbi:hypothetical protein HII31_00360 [Pseudocercospora fuligena]|uniref:Uncharacterized protein n=1 Tax=Pseudocercospora fuligena TaxID=685502 RepID=A0A8H6RYN6_9PEZI|nr:hypothetical protein HII31_00360 [Pseudocercospora fuligena]
MIVAVPNWHRPYEQPLQLEYGCHFDGSVKARDAYQPDSPECDRFERHTRVEFSEWMQSTKEVDASLGYVKALTGLAHFEGTKATPPYFAITMYAKSDYGVLRSKVLELARVHYPEIEEPIIRFYRGFYDVDL